MQRWETDTRICDPGIFLVDALLRIDVLTEEEQAHVYSHSIQRDYPNLALLFWRLTGNLEVDEEKLPNNEYHANWFEARLRAMCNRIAFHP